MDEQLGQNSPNSPTPSQGQSEQKSWGPAIGLVVILLIIIAGSFYFFRGGTPKGDAPNQEAEPSITDIEDELQSLREQSESDEVADIKADLDDTDVSGLDEELNLAEDEVAQLGY